MWRNAVNLHVESRRRRPSETGKLHWLLSTRRYTALHVSSEPDALARRVGQNLRMNRLSEFGHNVGARADDSTIAARMSSHGLSFAPYVKPSRLLWVWSLRSYVARRCSGGAEASEFGHRVSHWQGQGQVHAQQPRCLATSASADPGGRACERRRSATGPFWRCRSFTGKGIATC